MELWDRSYRFELLTIETAEEYLKRKAEEKAELHAAALAERKEIEKKQKGLCDCGGEYPRWVHNDEFFICSECFIHDLQCQADVMVPRHHVDDMDGYIDYTCWDELWEEENNASIISLTK